jgi:hypothetical protein
MSFNDNNTVYEFTAAIAQTNANIPSLQNLTVETIKAFVNPGIKELEKILLEDSERIFTQNNALRSIDSEHHNEWLQDIAEEVGTIEERTQRLERKLSGPETDASLYNRVKDIEETVDDIRSEIQRLNDNLDILRRFCERKKRKRVE